MVNAFDESNPEYRFSPNASGATFQIQVRADATTWVEIDPPIPAPSFDEATGRAVALARLDDDGNMRVLVHGTTPGGGYAWQETVFALRREGA